MRLPLSTDARARAAALRLQDSPGKADSLTRIASESGTSLRTLKRAFPRETGLTLVAWRRCTARATGA
jgi:methylphosphotriester-DNA--protein-cysteine methyltransferase